MHINFIIHISLIKVYFVLLNIVFLQIKSSDRNIIHMHEFYNSYILLALPAIITSPIDRVDEFLKIELIRSRVYTFQQIQFACSHIQSLHVLTDRVYTCSVMPIIAIFWLCRFAGWHNLLVIPVCRLCRLLKFSGGAGFSICRLLAISK